MLTGVYYLMIHMTLQSLINGRDFNEVRSCTHNRCDFQEMDQPIQLNIFFNSPLSPIGLESELHRTSPSLITEIYQFPISPCIAPGCALSASNFNVTIYHTCDGILGMRGNQKTIRLIHR